jgi:hypothetical protein
MKRSLLAIGLACLALGGNRAAACTDYSLEQCRRDFVNQNVPHPAVDPNDPRLGTIRDFLKNAKSWGDQEKTARDLIPQTTDVDQILILGKKLKEAQQQRKDQMDRAIQMTVEAYHLTPGVLVAPSHDNARTLPIDVGPWRPHFSENEQVDPKTGHGRLLNEKEKEDLGTKVGIPSGGDFTGRTDPKDANIKIFPGASIVADIKLMNDPDSLTDPGHLAATIFHETAHWLDHAASGSKLEPKDTYLSEQRAYLQTAALQTVFGLTDDEKKSMEGLAARYAKRAQEVGDKHWSQVQRDFPDDLPPAIMPVFQAEASAPGSPGNPESTRNAGDQNFFDGLDQLGNISHEAKQMTEAAEKRDAELAEQRRQGMKAQQAALEAANAQRYQAVLNYLEALSTLACSDPQAFQAQIDQRHFIAAMTSLEYMSGYRNYNPRNCKEFVLDKIGSANAPVSPTWVLAWAKKYHADHPGFWKQVGDALNNFFAAINEVESQSSSSSGGGSTPDPTPTRTPPQRNDPPSQSQGGGNMWHGSGALSQLGGISGGF